MTGRRACVIRRGPYPTDPRLHRHVPALINRAGSVLQYFDESCFEFFESRDPEDLARAIRRLHDDPERRRRRVQRALEVVEPYHWEYQRKVYLQHVLGLLGPRPLSESLIDTPSLA